MENIINKLEVVGSYIKKIANLIYKYRYYIAIIVFILCVLFEISGSSITMWKNAGFEISDVENDGLIWGTARPIRTDEWAVLTPMSFSQSFDGFKYFSSLVRGGDNTDVFIVYGLPTMNIMEVFRPFQIGFLFLGLAKGLSFFWYGRSIALFLVMIEFFMIITKKDKLLSVVAAIMVALAPFVQWWFAVNGIAEIFIFGSLAIVLLDKYMNTDNLKRRCLYLLGMVISAGGYILVFYPPWQISMAYVFLILAIWVIVKNRKNCKINAKDIISISVAIALLVACMSYVLLKSWDTIKTVMNTAYPGTRAVTGGDIKLEYFDYIMNIFLPFKGAADISPCGKCRMFGLFPLGIILAIIVLIKEKKKDLLLILALILNVFMIIWLSVGFPEIIAKLTLMSKAQPVRAILAAGFLDVIILIRSMALMKKPVKVIPSILISLVLTAIVVYLAKISSETYIDKNMIIIMGIMCLCLFFFAMRYKAKFSKYLFAIGMSSVMIVSGATVNPVQKGVDVIYESSLVKEVQRLNTEDGGKWIVESAGFPLPNFILAAGVPVINSTNTYPDMEKWHNLDSEDKYEEIYNRYAHISVEVIKNNEDKPEKFVYGRPDVFLVYLTPEEMKQMEVKYIVSLRDNLEDFNDENCQFNEVSKVNNKFYIYKAIYNPS